MLWSNWEYIPLRLLRRHLVTDRFLAKCGRLLPYYQCSQNQVDPRPIVDLYEKYLQGRGLVIS
ncbi:MAG: hypothetical protein PHU44_14800, partial [Syntrophales bacterium]|nr:hypothetical protein [Syntrophales bacterium]